MVDVTQADREAGAALGGLVGYLSRRDRANMLDGKWDDTSYPQAFAAHRETSTASLQAEIAELRHALATLDVWPAWASSLLDIMREFTGERYGSDEEIDLPEELRNWLAGYRVEIERDASRTLLNKDKSNG